MNIRALDLNLVRVLDALVRTKSVTAAGRELALSQPAVSNALARLRHALGDELFVRAGRTLVATPRARSAGEVTGEVLARLEAGLFGDKPFDPATARGRVCLATSDYWHHTLLPHLLEALDRDAPNVELALEPLGRGADVGELLAQGVADVAIYLANRGGGRLRARPLVRDEYVVCARRNHPVLGRRTTVDALRSLQEVVLAPRGLGILREDALLRRPRRIETPHLEVAIQLVAMSNRYALIPRRLAESARARWPIALHRPPFDAGSVELDLHWHERSDADPLHRWIRELIARMVDASYGAPVASPRPSRRRSKRNG